MSEMSELTLRLHEENQRLNLRVWELERQLDVEKAVNSRLVELMAKVKSSVTYIQEGPKPEIKP